MGQSLHTLSMWFHLPCFTTDFPPRPRKKSYNPPKHHSRDSSETEVEQPLDHHNARNGEMTAIEKMSRTGVPVSGEYNKMVSGSPFRVVQCPDLQAKKLQARAFCTKYNLDDQVLNAPSMPQAEVFMALRQERERLLRTIIGKVGKTPVIEPPFNFQYGCNIIIGDLFYANVNLRILDSGIVSIGDRVLIAPNVTIVTESHDKEVEPRREGIVYARPVSIGDDCWIGVGATILPGVSIGKGTTIGAGSVVTRDIPPSCVAYGVPARVAYGVKDSDTERAMRMV